MIYGHLGIPERYAACFGGRPGPALEKYDLGQADKAGSGA